MPGFPVLHYLLEFAQTHVHWVGDDIQPSHPLSPPFPLALSLSQDQGLFNELPLHSRWPKYWSFIFSISPSNEYSGLIAFSIDWFGLLAGQETLESSPAPQFKNVNSLVLSLLYGLILVSVHDYWKTIALTIWIFVGKVTSLLFNMLSRLVIIFLPKSKSLLISWLQSSSTVIWEPKKINSVTVSTFSHLFVVKW